MHLLTEPIGSIPRPPELIATTADYLAGRASRAALDESRDRAVRDTIKMLEATGSPVVSDGEQAKPSFATYAIAESPNLVPDGVTIPFADGHSRQLPCLVTRPFRYEMYAGPYVEAARRYASVPVKQAVISASALSLLYPPGGIDGYTHDEFVADLVQEAQADIRSALAAGAHRVQIDFTEGRLSVKLDPSKALLGTFLELNRRVLAGFSAAERARIGVHSCPGGDEDSTHSLDTDYGDLLPGLFGLPVGNFYIQLASEPDKRRVLSIVRDNLPLGATVFVGVVDPIDPRIETAEEVRDRILEAAEYIPVNQLGSCDDCGFAPFGDDTSTSRETAFQKIRARVEGTRLAGSKLGA